MNAWSVTIKDIDLTRPILSGLRDIVLTLDCVGSLISSFSMRTECVSNAVLFNNENDPLPEIVAWRIL